MENDRDYKKIRKSIEDYLIVRGNAEDTDGLLIDELMFNLKMLDDAKLAIAEQGYTLNTTKNKKKEPFFVMNRNVAVYQLAFKHISTLFKQLSMTPEERTKLKLNVSMDSFDSGFEKRISEKG